jgi:redox-sensitive bicupin YhaK (pirin superfamily)
LRTHQDALIFSSILDPGHHLFHELLPGRSAWLHLVCGEATLNNIILTQGDGAGVTIEPSVSLTVQEKSEILLVDLGPAPDSIGSGVAR